MTHESVTKLAIRQRSNERALPGGIDLIVALRRETDWCLSL